MASSVNYRTQLLKLHEKYFRGLSEDDQQAFRDYSSDHYGEVNHWLRYRDFTEDSTDLERGQALDIVYRMDKVISQAPPLTQPVIVYRGIPGDYISEFIPKLKVGDTVDLFQYGFNSCSFKPEIGANFSLGSGSSQSPVGCCLFALYLPVGTPGLYLGYNSQHPLEDEFILGPTPNFRVFQFPGESFPAVYQANASTKPVHMYRLACNDYKPI